MHLTAPRWLGGVNLTFRTSGGERTVVNIQAGGSAKLRVPVCSARSARVTYRSSRTTFLGLRPVSAKATKPVFTPSRSACR
jgi:hypothetical protein